MKSENRGKRDTLLLEIPDADFIDKTTTPVNLHLAEVTPSLFISSYRSTKNIADLKDKGITHILNLSASTTCENVYEDQFTYCSLKMPDNPTADIYEHLATALDFIEQSIENGGKVLVHCLRGKSRAPTVACAYLMVKSKIPTEKALKIIRKKQPYSSPNFGFIAQLILLEEQSFKI